MNNINTESIITPNENIITPVKEITDGDSLNKSFAYSGSLVKKLKMKIGKLPKKNESVKQTTSLLRCRCCNYSCICHRSYDFSKELCEEATHKLAIKYGFDVNEAMVYLFDS